MKRKERTHLLAEGAVIAALYAAVTYFAAPISFGSQQLRVSEAMTILPIFTPSAIPGLAIGCLIANLGSPYGAVDIICGTAATLLAAVCTRLTRNIRIKNMPLLSLIFPVIFNGIIIGAEIAFLMPEGISLAGFVLSGASVAFGEFIVCYALGLPLFAILDRTRIFRR